MAPIPPLRSTLVGVAVVSVIAVAASVADAHGGKCDFKNWPGFQNFETLLAVKDTPASLPPPAHRIISPGRPIPGAPTPASAPITLLPGETGRAPRPFPVLAVPDTPVLGPLFGGASTGRPTPSAAPGPRK